jgi:hypothetical protein
VNDICECEAAICRTPGFWGTHPTETQTLLNHLGGVTICGVPVQAYDDCAAEGLCNSPKGNKQLITARHLLTTALNCVLTSGDYTCGGQATELGNLFSTCNAACAANTTAVMAVCAPQLDCYNNGGHWEDALRLGLQLMGRGPHLSDPDPTNSASRSATATTSRWTVGWSPSPSRPTRPSRSCVRRPPSRRTPSSPRECVQSDAKRRDAFGRLAVLHAR